MSYNIQASGASTSCSLQLLCDMPPAMPGTVLPLVLLQSQASRSPVVVGLVISTEALLAISCYQVLKLLLCRQTHFDVQVRADISTNLHIPQYRVTKKKPR